MGRKELLGGAKRIVIKIGTSTLTNADGSINERDGYFEAQEIQLLLALLSVIDNPEQDLPMAAVLHSGLVGL
ncbi:MAG: hypothetical protein ACFNVQ_03135, partial [Campylobacter sp.]